MSYFKKLFGVNEQEIKKICIIMPILFSEAKKILGIKNLSKGILYNVGQQQIFSIIHTGISAELIGDAVLYLENTACKYLILYGCCGSIASKELEIGALISPYICYDFGNFIDMLSGKAKINRAFYPAKNLLELIDKVGEGKIKKVSAISVSSIKLENQYLDLFRKKGIEAIDMECASFFAAASKIRKKAAALFFVSDNLIDKLFYSQYSQEEKIKIDKGKELGLNFLWKIIESLKD